MGEHARRARPCTLVSGPLPSTPSDDRRDDARQHVPRCSVPRVPHYAMGPSHRLYPAPRPRRHLRAAPVGRHRAHLAPLSGGVDSAGTVHCRLAVRAALVSGVARGGGAAGDAPVCRRGVRSRDDAAVQRTGERWLLPFSDTSRMGC